MYYNPPLKYPGKGKTDIHYRALRDRITTLEGMNKKVIEDKNNMNVKLDATQKQLSICQEQLQRTLARRENKPVNLVEQNSNLKKTLMAKQWENEIFRKQLLEAGMGICKKCLELKKRLSNSLKSSNKREQELQDQIHDLRKAVRMWRDIAETKDEGTVNCIVLKLNEENSILRNQLRGIKNELSKQRHLTGDFKIWKQAVIDMVNTMRGDPTIPLQEQVLQILERTEDGEEIAKIIETTNGMNKPQDSCHIYCHDSIEECESEIHSDADVPLIDDDKDAVYKVEPLTIPLKKDTQKEDEDGIYNDGDDTPAGRSPPVAFTPGGFTPPVEKDIQTPVPGVHGKSAPECVPTDHEIPHENGIDPHSENKENNIDDDGIYNDDGGNDPLKKENDIDDDGIYNDDGGSPQEEKYRSPSKTSTPRSRRILIRREQKQRPMTPTHKNQQSLLIPVRSTTPITDSQMTARTLMTPFGRPQSAKPHSTRAKIPQRIRPQSALPKGTVPPMIGTGACMTVGTPKKAIAPAEKNKKGVGRGRASPSRKKEVDPLERIIETPEDALHMFSKSFQDIFDAQTTIWDKIPKLHWNVLAQEKERLEEEMKIQIGKITTECQNEILIANNRTQETERLGNIRSNKLLERIAELNPEEFDKMKEELEQTKQEVNDLQYSIMNYFDNCINKEEEKEKLTKAELNIRVLKSALRQKHRHDNFIRLARGGSSELLEPDSDETRANSKTSGCVTPRVFQYPLGDAPENEISLGLPSVPGWSPSPRTPNIIEKMGKENRQGSKQSYDYLAQQFAVPPPDAIIGQSNTWEKREMIDHTKFGEAAEKDALEIITSALNGGQAYMSTLPRPQSASVLHSGNVRRNVRPKTATHRTRIEQNEQSPNNGPPGSHRRAKLKKTFIIPDLTVKGDAVVDEAKREKEEKKGTDYFAAHREFLEQQKEYEKQLWALKKGYNYKIEMIQDAFNDERNKWIVLYTRVMSKVMNSELASQASEHLLWCKGFQKILEKDPLAIEDHAEDLKKLENHESQEQSPNKRILINVPSSNGL